MLYAARVADIRTQLADIGDVRRNANGELERTSAEIVKLAPRAIKAGVKKIEICTLTGISRPTLDDMLKR